jgi:hypothetical protein
LVGLVNGISQAIPSATELDSQALRDEQATVEGGVA